jgi:thiol-disulfide isomerase/thioredoxin
MKRFFILTAVLYTAISTNLNAQTPYTSSKDEKHPEVTVLNGIISKYALQNYDSFMWYLSNQGIYDPAPEIIKAMELAKDKVQFVIFGGTWCEDTQFIIPRFFKLQEKSGFPDKSISFFGVNRAKETLGNITAAFKITNVPTIIVMKDGKEIGRIVEYGKTGKWDTELAELLK